METLTLIDPKSNACKVYHIDGGSSLYGRIGCTMRKGVVKSDTKYKKERKGYVRTILVNIPSDYDVFSQIKMFRYERGTWVAYGYLNGYYRPLGMNFSNEQMVQFATFGPKSFNSWNWGAIKV